VNLVGFKRHFAATLRLFFNPEHHSELKNESRLTSKSALLNPTRFTQTASKPMPLQFVGNQSVVSPVLPQRIVSLVPSQTELLYDLGLGDRVVGITKFCVRPTEWYRSKTRIGGTKTVDVARVAALQPDFILANREENQREQVEALAAFCPVWVSNVTTLNDALEMIIEVGLLTGVGSVAQEMVQRIQTNFAILPTRPLRRAAYLIWRKPWMVAGGDTFISDLMRRAGFENVFGGLNRYPEVSREALEAANPEVILLSSEPFPFAAKHVAECRAICPEAEIRLVDGELFSWYGSRLLQAPQYFAGL
jgi:ABC-type Fe3+-hydroxamate transport system substrate-binding protein